jgi:hypothetical protein
MTHTQLYATATSSKAVSVVAAYDKHFGSNASPPELFVGTVSLSFGAGLLSFGIGGGTIKDMIRHRGPDCGSKPRMPERREPAPDAAAARRYDGANGLSTLLVVACHSPPIFVDFISFSVGLGSTA